MCDVCGPWLARRTARAIDARGYDRWLTLTRVPTDFRGYMKRLTYLIRREQPYECIWSVEHGPKTGMRHIHACVRAGWIENRGNQLTAKSRAAGGGFVYITLRDGGAADYASKCASYAAKQAGVGYQVWREWNKGRVWRCSRGWTEGVPMRDWVRRYAPSTDKGPWRSIRPHEFAEGREWQDWVRGMQAAALEAADAQLAETRPARRIAFEALATVAQTFPEARDELAWRRDLDPPARPTTNAFDGWKQAERARRERESRQARRPTIPNGG